MLSKSNFTSYMSDVFDLEEFEFLSGALCDSDFIDSFPGHDVIGGEPPCPQEFRWINTGPPPIQDSEPARDEPPPQSHVPLIDFGSRAERLIFKEIVERLRRFEYGLRTRAPVQTTRMPGSSKTSEWESQFYQIAVVICTEAKKLASKDAILYLVERMNQAGFTEFRITRDHKRCKQTLLAHLDQRHDLLETMKRPDVAYWIYIWFHQWKALKEQAH